MTESEEKQLESLCADVPYMFVLNNKNEIIYVVNDTQLTSTTEKEYQQALDSFIARRYQFRSLYELMNENFITKSTGTELQICMKCQSVPKPMVILNMCIHEFIHFLECVFKERNIIQLN